MMSMHLAEAACDMLETATMLNTPNAMCPREHGDPAQPASKSPRHAELSVS